MPLMKLEFEAGINRTGTSYSAEGGWYDCNNIRFRDGRAETIGGWQAVGGVEFQGIARGMFSWADLDGNPFTVVGTTWKVYVVAGEQAYDITPLRVPEATLGATPFSSNPDRNETIGTTAYTIIRVTHAAHLAEKNDFVTFSGATTTGSSPNFSGNAIDDTIMNAEYQVVDIVSANIYEVRILGSAKAASGEQAFGAGTVLVNYKIHSGLYAPVGGTGWGASAFGGEPELGTILPATVTAINTGSSILSTGTASFDVVDGGNLAVGGGTLKVANELITYSAAVQTSPGTVTVSARGVLGTEEYQQSHAQDSEVIDITGDWYGWGEAAEVEVGRKEIRLWSFDNNGEDLVVLVRGQSMYYWDTDVATLNGVPNSDGTELLVEINNDDPIDGVTPTQPPQLSNQMIISDRDGHVIALGCNDLTGGDDPKINPTLVRWADQNNVFDWLPSSINTSGGQRLSKGSKIIGSIGTKAEVLIWTDAALYSMRFIGPPDIFSFTLVSGATTLFARHAVVAAANMVFFMGESDFYVYQGTINPLPSTVAKYIFDDICKDAKEKIFCGSNRQFSEVMWFYPSRGQLDVDRYVCFNYLDRTWTFGKFDMESMSNEFPISTTTSRARTSWIDLEIDPNPMATYVKQFDNNRVDSLGNPIDPPIELSSIVTHESGRQAFSSPMNTFIQSGFFDIAEGDQYMLYNKVLPDLRIIDGTPGSLSTTVDISLINDDYPLGTAPVSEVSEIPVGSKVTVAPENTSYAGYTNLRGRARSIAVKFSPDANGYGWRVGSTRINLQPDGRR